MISLLGKHKETLLAIGTYLGIFVMCCDRYFIYPVSAFHFKNSPIFLIGISIFVVCYFVLILKSKPSPLLLIPGAFFCLLFSLLNTGLLNGYTIVSDTYVRLEFFDKFVLGDPYTYLSQIYARVYGMFAYLLVINKVTAIDSSTLSTLLRTLCDFTVFLVIYLLSRHLFKNEKVALFSGLLYLVFSPLHMHYCAGAQGTLLALLALYFLFTSQLRQPGELMLCNLAVVALVSTHHFTNYTYIIALLSGVLFFLIGRSIPQVRSFFHGLNYHTLLYLTFFAVVASISWYLYVAQGLFSNFAHYVFRPEQTGMFNPIVLAYTPWAEKILSRSPMFTALILTAFYLYYIAKERESLKSPLFVLYLGAALGLGIHFAFTFIGQFAGIHYVTTPLVSPPLLYYLVLAMPLFGGAVFYFLRQRLSWLILLPLFLFSIIPPALYDDPTSPYGFPVYTTSDYSTVVFTEEKIPSDATVEVGGPFSAFLAWKSDRVLRGDHEFFYGDSAPADYISTHKLASQDTFVVLSRQLAPQVGGPRAYRTERLHLLWTTSVEQVMARFDTQQFDRVFSNNRFAIYRFRKEASITTGESKP